MANDERSIWNYQPFIVYGLSIVVVFGPFLAFVFSGWGG